MKTKKSSPEGSSRLSNRNGPAMVEKFVVRLPAGLRNQLKQLSDQHRRSMNSEIIMVLENHIRQQFIDQLAEGTPDAEGNFPDGVRTEQDLGRLLEMLPREKKAALLELLG